MHAWDVPVLSFHRDGEELLIDGEGIDGYLWRKGSEGLSMPPVEITKADNPGGHGSIVRQVRFVDRELFLPIHLSAPTYRELTPMRRRLEALLDPTLGPVEVRLTEDGSSRSAFGYYSGGMEGAFGKSDIGFQFQKFGLTFDCPDPFWYGGEQAATWFISQAAKPLIGGGAFFPIVLQASVVAGQTRVTVQGDAETIPTFTVVGPGEFLVIENETTGQVFRYNGSISGTLTASSDDVSATGVSDEDLWDDVPPGDEVPILVPGENVVSVQMSDANPRSSVRMTWRDAYRSGH